MSFFNSLGSIAIEISLLSFFHVHTTKECTVLEGSEMYGGVIILHCMELWESAMSMGKIKSRSQGCSKHFSNPKMVWLACRMGVRTEVRTEVRIW